MPVVERRSESLTPSRASLERISDTELVWKHTLRAKVAVVFEAYTRPELVKRWWAPRSRGLEMVRCEAEVKVGGTYLYALARGGRVVVTFSGRYLEVDPPKRLVYTAAMAPFSDEVVATVTFEEREGLTHLVAREVYPSKKVLDDAIASGMEAGARETFDLLADLVPTL